MLIEYANYKNEFFKLIDTKQNFEICNVPKAEMLEVCGVLEAYIEKKHLKCRIYTQKRLLTGAAGLLNPAYGIFSLVSIAAHNILTYDPDYEIGRDLANNRITVEYKKKDI